ncbi:MAG: hypothetical protein ACLQRH_02990 [Acidimicrobiales bacterium]
MPKAPTAWQKEDEEHDTDRYEVTDSASSVDHEEPFQITALP